jgi:hypothetical protein
MSVVSYSFRAARILKQPMIKSAQSKHSLRHFINNYRLTYLRDARQYQSSTKSSDLFNSLSQKASNLFHKTREQATNTASWATDEASKQLKEATHKLKHTNVSEYIKQTSLKVNGTLKEASDHTASQFTRTTHKLQQQSKVALTKASHASSEYLKEASTISFKKAKESAKAVTDTIGEHARKVSLPVQSTWERSKHSLFWWSLLAIFLYGVGSQVPHALANHYARHPSKENERDSE